MSRSTSNQSSRGRDAFVTIGSLYESNIQAAVQQQLPQAGQNLPDPLDEIFNRFTAVKRTVDCVVLDENQDEAEQGPSSNIKVDEGAVPTAIKAEEDDDIVIIDEKKKETDVKLQSTIVKNDIDCIQIDEEGDDEIMVVAEIPATSSNEGDSEEKPPTEVAFTVGLKTAAMEDSLVKGTVQQFQQFIRHWEVIAEPIRSTGYRSSVIRVCSYNILCQDTIERTRHLYRHLLDINFEFPLLWENRWPLLAQNFIHINADIFALQEVQESHFNGYINKLMTSQGYGAMWTKKSAIGSVDGCALFYKLEKFEYVFSRPVQYFCGIGTILDKPQIGQILRLRCRETKKEIVIANTHILFNMKRGDIKLAQIAILFANIKKEFDEHGNAPLIIMGDFNMDPLSYLYTFIVRGSLYLRGLSRGCLANTKDKSTNNIVNADTIIPPDLKIARDSMFIDDSVKRKPVANDTFTHPFELWNAYGPLNNGLKLAETISTYHIDKGTPDFIFYSVKKKSFQANKSEVVETSDLKLLRRVTLPFLADCLKTLGPWPNQHVPSDHIPLIADFQLRAYNNV